MEIKLMPNALDDIEFWKKSGNKAILKKLANWLKTFVKRLFKVLVNQNP